jgi:hypothetical protein
MPAELWDECVRRFIYGDTAKDVAQWLFVQPDRGGVQHLSFNTLRFYLQVLRERVLAADKESRIQRRNTIRHVARAIQQEERKRNNVVSIRQAVEEAKGTASPAQQEPPKERTLSDIEEEIEAMIEYVDANYMSIFNFAVLKERLKKPLEVERNLGVPLLEVTKINHEINNAAQVKASVELAAIKRMKAKADITQDDFEAITTDPTKAGDEFDQAVAKLSPAQYDKTITLSRYLTEFANLKREQAQLMAESESPDDPER